MFVFYKIYFVLNLYIIPSFSAWVQEDSIWNYADNKAKFTVTSRIPRGYNVAIEAIEDVIKAMPSQVGHICLICIFKYKYLN